MPDENLGDLQKELNQFSLDVKKLRDDTLTAWEEYKKENDKRLSTIEAKQTVDPLLEEKVTKIGLSIVSQQEKFDQFSATLQRLNQATSNGHGGTEHKHAHRFFQTYSALRNPAMVVKPEEVNLQAYEDYKSAWNRYLRKDDKSMTPDEFKALQVGSDPDGGYLVNPEMSQRIIDRVFETSPMRQLATIETIGTMSLELLVDIDDINAEWVGETQARNETNTPTWRKKQIPVHELYAKPKATQTMLDDASRDVETWLSNKVSNKFSRTEAAAFLTGNGTGKPRGILTYPNGTSWGQVQQIPTLHATQVTPDSLIDITFSLKEPFYANSTFLMNRTTIATVMKFKDGQGQYLWAPNFQNGQPATLAGYPIRFANDMPAIAAGAIPVAFGDFREAYTIVDRIGIRVLRDPYTDQPFVRFGTTKRVGGDVVNYESYKLLVVSAS